MPAETDAAVPPLDAFDAVFAELAEAMAAGVAPRDAVLTEGERDLLLLRIDANLRAFGMLLAQYQPLLDRANAKVTRFGRGRT